LEAKTIPLAGMRWRALTSTVETAAFFGGGGHGIRKFYQ